MTDEQKRRINDHRPAVGLQWDENNPPPRVPFDRPEQWTILLTSGNHGLVGSYGHTFPHAEGDHERINVVDEAVVIKLRKRIRELDAAGNTNKAVLTDEQIGKLGDEILSLHRQLAAEKLRADQGWERAKAKSKECIELRERLPAPAPADNPSTAGAGNERALFESWAQGRVTSLIQGKFGTGYVYADAARAWDAWKARASLAAPALNPSDVQWAQWIVHRGPGLPDYACADCVPNSHMLKPGFQCVYHEAAAVLKGAPAQSVEGGEA